MIRNAANAGAKLTRSSTFWASILFPALKILAGTYLGVDVPWEVILAGIGAQGVRNAAEHVGNGLRDAASTAADAHEGYGGILAGAMSGALGALGLGAPSASGAKPQTK